MFGKILNMMKNEKIVLDIDSEALCMGPVVI